MSFELKYVVIADDKRKIGTLVFYTYFIIHGHIKKDVSLTFGFTLHSEGVANSRQYIGYAKKALCVYYI